MQATPDTPSPTRTKLLDAARDVMRAKGYTATTVGDLCGAAGVTKGAFFHHFRSKEEVAVAAAEHFASMAERLFANAPFMAADDPLERLLGYVDFRIEILTGPIAQYTCLLGTFVQELYETHPSIREACDVHLGAHVGWLTGQVAAAKGRHVPDAPWSAEGLAFHVQAVVQGSFIFAKAKLGPEVAIECLRHLRRYLETLFIGARQEELRQAGA